MDWLELGKEIARQGLPVLGAVVAATPYSDLAARLCNEFLQEEQAAARAQEEAECKEKGVPLPAPELRKGMPVKINVDVNTIDVPHLMSKIQNDPDAKTKLNSIQSFSPLTIQMVLPILASLITKLL